MRQMKKLICMMMTATMLTAAAVPVFADTGTKHTITITGGEEGHTYEAYQIFSGQLETKTNGTKNTMVLVDIDWGEGIAEEGLLADLKDNSKNTYADSYQNCESAEDVAAVLREFGDNSKQLDVFARLAGENLASPAGTSTEEREPYSISVTGDGYYFVKDKNAVAGNDAATKYILEVVDDITVKVKSEVPQIEKWIRESDSTNGSDGKGTAQAVGDTVQFKLTSTVPKMDGYTSYQYIICDTLSEGLVFNDDVKITIGNTELTKDIDFKVVTETEDSCTFHIEFTDFIKWKEYKSENIIVKYSAGLTKATLTTERETNTVFLKFSNNPYQADSTGKTPESVVYVYDFELEIDKYTGDTDTGTRLSGAMFVLKNKTQYYAQDPESKAVSWVTGPGAFSTAGMTPEEIQEKWTEKGIVVVKTGEDGKASFEGIDSGYYELVEIVAPSGYNLLKEAVEIEVKAVYEDDGTLNQTETSAKLEKKGQDGKTYKQTVKVKNESGLELPSTGGMGTALFYIFGSILVLGASVLLIVRQRMQKDE